MRTENLNRLNSTDIKIDNLYYLHYKYYHADLFSAFDKYACGSLLDIGCGNKPYQDKLADKIINYTGVDIIQSSENKVDYLCPANNIPLENNSFDTVISTQTIEHVEDHQGLVNEAYRLLKTEGLFILSGPLYWPLHEEPYDFFRFTKHGFQYILEKAGFEVLEIKSNGGKWSVAGQALLHALFPQIYSISGFKGKLMRTILKMIGGIKSLNKFFVFMDNQGTIDYSNTMNYVIVAKKTK
ncbi:class I SAM-dependent methyltransferase [Pedobacter sp. CFBP9032]|uniref:class I SAM-dependent methyltransferase n=1 Tax=Pedobacter sp. CFBP9032 TaxID=3096539 RepID=UPI002A6B0050|nr:class I SAM-dependent methyltransferase [Pedobacter sp. CFBP9032]MDY0907441.1 class I SAM-dependent methyltransferase [Pedobacter sp. CFBP9032]